MAQPTIRTLVSASPRPLRAIIIDDSREDMVMLRRMLAETLPDIEVTEYDPDQQGKPGPNFDWSAYDVLLLDMQMPIMDGYQAAATLRAGGHAGPILALTANVLPVDRKRCLAAGCDDYASKPIDVDDLCSKLGRLTGRAKSGT